MKEWEEYQKLGDEYYNQGKIKEAEQCWNIALNLREEPYKIKQQKWKEGK